MASWYKVVLSPKTLSNNQWGPASFQQQTENFLKSWECPLVEKVYYTDEYRTDIIIAEDTTISYEYGYGGGTISINDESYGDAFYYSHPATLWVIFSDDFFYFSHQINSTKKLTYLYETIEDVIYEGWDHGSALQNLILKEKGVEDSPEYIHRRILDYNTNFSQIDYTDSRLFIREEVEGSNSTIDVITKIIDPYFISCSAVPVDTIISFDETRFYSIDANNLVALEPVEPYWEEDEDDKDEDE